MAGKTQQTTNEPRLAPRHSCYDFLSNATQTTGWITAKAKAFLQIDELLDHVNCLITYSVIQDIKGVPFTIVANQWAIQGAETAESFYRAFNFAATQAESRAPPTNFAPACSLPASNTLVTPEGLASKASACKTNAGTTTEYDAYPAVSETSTTGGASATTPNASQLTFGDGTLVAVQGIYVLNGLVYGVGVDVVA